VMTSAGMFAFLAANIICIRSAEKRSFAEAVPQFDHVFHNFDTECPENPRPIPSRCP
jgi:hypothetical protein